jgi:hypothetical protein
MIEKLLFEMNTYAALSPATTEILKTIFQVKQFKK